MVELIGENMFPAAQNTSLVSSATASLLAPPDSQSLGSAGVDAVMSEEEANRKRGRENCVVADVEHEDIFLKQYKMLQKLTGQWSDPSLLVTLLQQQAEVLKRIPFDDTVQVPSTCTISAPQSAQPSVAGSSKHQLHPQILEGLKKLANGVEKDMHRSVKATRGVDKFSGHIDSLNSGDVPQEPFFYRTDMSDKFIDEKWQSTEASNHVINVGFNQGFSRRQAEDP